MNTIKSIKDTLKEIILGNDYVCDTFLHSEGTDEIFGFTVFDYIKHFTRSRLENHTGTIYDVTDTQIKRCINEIMDSYGLKKVKANKLLKEQFDIKSDGYPNIVIEDVLIQ